MHYECACLGYFGDVKKKLKKASFSFMASAENNQWKEQCLEAEDRCRMWREKAMAYELVIKELEDFRDRHRRVWGALHVEELAVLVRTEQALMDRDPQAFMARYHDAVFTRTRLDEQQVLFNDQLATMSRMVETSKATSIVLEEELGVLKRHCAEQARKVLMSTAHADSLEQELAIVQHHLKTCNIRWMEAGEEICALRRKVVTLETSASLCKTALSSDHDGCNDSMCNEVDLYGHVACLCGYMDDA